MLKADGDIPQEVIYHVKGGPKFSTTIKGDDEGNEKRTRRWSAPKEIWQGFLTACSPETLAYFARNNKKIARFTIPTALEREAHVLIQFNASTKHVRLTAKQDQEKFDRVLDALPPHMRRDRPLQSEKK